MSPSVAMVARALALLLALLLCSRAQADVVINEIFYHAPDDLEELQFIEVHNTGDQAVDLGGWKFTKGVSYAFPANTRIEANGYLVICKSLAREAAAPWRTG